MKKIEEIKIILNSVSSIIRKYNIGDYDFFKSKFPNYSDEILNKCWRIALKKVKNRSIIKNSDELNSIEIEILNKKLLSLNIDSRYLIINNLNKDFNPRKLKLSDEKIERRIRNILAEKYISLSQNEVLKVENSIDIKSKIDKSNLLILFLPVLCISAIFISPIVDRLTPVEKLAIKIHKGSLRKTKIGAECFDGWRSSSKGSGTCSHHGGVRYWIYKESYSKSLDRARKEAKDISWIK